MKENLVRWLTLALLAFIWGSSFILMKIGLISVPFQELGALRLVIASLFLFPLGLRHWRKIDRKLWKYLIIVGLCGSGIPAFLFAYAQTFINSSLAGMLNSLVPIFTLSLGALLFQVKIKSVQVFGVSIGLMGSIFLFYNPSLAFDSSSWYGLYIVAATICYAISVNTIKRYLSSLSSPVITSTSLFTVGPLAGGYLLFFTGFTQNFSLDQQYLTSMLAITALAVLATGLAIVIFNMLIKRVSALYASSVTYLIPIVAIFWGVFDGESLQLFQFIGMSGILGGIYLINR